VSSTPQAVQPELAWEKPLHAFQDLLHLAPPVCRADDGLMSVVEAFSRDPGARCVYILDAGDRLLGAVPERALDRDLITLALPEVLWPEVHELDMRELVRLSRGGAQTARQLMSKAHAVTAAAPLKEAITLMVRSGETTIAVLDDQQRLLGYMALFEVLAQLAKR